MNKYLLIESSDPFEGPAVEPFYALAADLAEKGNEVLLFLVQNAVLAARASTASDAIGKAAARGVRIVVDDFSLRERGIDEARLHPAVEAAAIGVVVDKLADGYKAFWH